MRVFVLNIESFLTELFTRIHKNEVQTTRLRELSSIEISVKRFSIGDEIEYTLRSAAMRILYHDAGDAGGSWRMLSDSAYRLLDHYLNHYVISEQRRTNRRVDLSDYRVDVIVRGTFALFLFEQPATVMLGGTA